MKNGLSDRYIVPTKGRHYGQDSVFGHHIGIRRSRDYKERIQSLRSPGQTHVSLPQRLFIYL